MKQEILNKIQSMTVTEICSEIYTDHLTGCLNRKAFELDERQFLMIVDLDSLKYVNDHFGYRKGDDVLRALGVVLVDYFGWHNVYRLSGDEFAIKFSMPRHSHARIEKMRAKIPVFSYGYGVGLALADNDLKREKKSRLLYGQRSDRSECPPWIKDLDKIVKLGEI